MVVVAALVAVVYAVGLVMSMVLAASSAESDHEGVFALAAGGAWTLCFVFGLIVGSLSFRFFQWLLPLLLGM